MIPEIWSATDRIYCHFGPFFTLLPPLTTPKIKIFNNWKKTPGDILTFNICNINENHMMHSSWDMKRDGQKFFVIFDCFLPFCPLTTQKIKVLKKRKKVWRYYHFTHLYHKCQSYDVWFMRYEAGRTEFYVIFDCLVQFYPPNNPKNQILKNWKKHLEKKTNNFTHVYQKWQSNDVWFLRY